MRFEGRQAPPATATHQDRAEVEAIVMRYGRAPVDYFKTWPDKSYFFSSSRASVVAYGVAWSVAVSLGDPVGPVDELEPLILSFVSFCAGNGWRAAFQEVLPISSPSTNATDSAC
jgi:phosphatidylglycerol lysyltransferase